MIFALFEYNIYATIKNVNFSKFEHRRLDCYNNEIIVQITIMQNQWEP